MDQCANTCNCRRCVPFYVDKNSLSVDVTVKRPDGTTYLTNVFDVPSEATAKKRVQEQLPNGYEAIRANTVGYMKVWR